MKRILSLVLAMVMVLGSFTAVFAVEPTVADGAVEILMDLGVLTEGKLDQDLKRQDLMVLLSRLMGEEDEAKVFASDDLAFDDVTDPFYTGYVAWAVAKGLTNGKSATKFGFGDFLKTQELAMFLLRALGYADVAFEDALAEATTLGLLVDVAEGVTAKRGMMAVMTLNALKVNPKDSTVTLAEKLGLVLPVPAEATMTVSATGQKKLTVVFNKAVDTTKAVVTVKKGNITINTDKVVFAEDKMSAEITTITFLTKGDYTVSVAGLTEVALTATVAVLDVKVAKINITSDKAPMKAGANEKALVSYEVLNQYGEKMTGVAITWSASTGKAVVDDTAKNILTIESATTPTSFIPGNIVYITGVHATSGTVVNAQVEVVLASRADTVVFKGVYNTTDAKLADLPAGFAANKYVLLLEVLDQYGKKVSTFDMKDLVFTSNNPMFVASPATPLTLADFGVDVVLGGVTYTAIKLVPGSAPQNGGALTIQAISLLSGKTAVFTTEAEALASVKSFSMSAPDTVISAGEKVEIPFVAIDQYGNAVTKFASLGSDKVTLTGSLAMEKQKDGSAKLYYTAGAKGLVYVTSLVTSGGNFSSLMLDVKDTAVATTITKVDVPALFENDAAATIKIGYADLTVVDQYNRKIKLTNEVIKVTTAAVTPVVANDGVQLVNSASETVFTGTANVGSVVYTFSIVGKDQSEFNVTLGTVASKDITSYELSAAGTMFAGTNKTLTLTGKTANGSSVVLIPTKVTHAASSTAVATVLPATAKAGVIVTAVAEKKGEAVISAWAGATKLAEVTVTVSTDLQVPTTLSFKAATTYTVAEGATFDMVANLVAKDQYGEAIDATTGAIWTTSDATVATVAAGTVTGVKAGSVTIGFVTKNGIVVTQVLDVTESLAP